ncbi:MAG: 16S rRNA (guanine(966)-N(2))-methyltransferase RsmD [candidate division Zixibacteria bacterium]|nr:16S rRNA (guanine(966)-N(2))-methyltransferase RsmD [candidate division Zixibacteria bacterium]
MRVTGGIYGGRSLKAASGMVSRPTTDKVRQSIFNILMNDIEDKEVLDIFAGSGALGIEAISRGASSTVFIEKGFHQADAIKANLKSLELSSRLIKSDFKTACSLLKEEGIKFDLVFADPPYDKYSPDDVAEVVAQYDLLRSDGFLIIEHKFGVEVTDSRFKLLKRRKFGQTEVTFYAVSKDKN